MPSLRQPSYSENRWPPDNVKTVSIPLAFSRRAISRPAWKVSPASLPMGAAYRPSYGTFAGKHPLDVGRTAALARRRDLGAKAFRAVDRLVRGNHRFGVVARQRLGDRRGVRPVGADPAAIRHRVGPPVLADHRRLLRRATRGDGLAAVGGPTAVGSAFGAFDGAAQFSEQGHVHVASNSVRGRCHG